MLDTCTITAAGAGEPVYDPETDTYTYPAATTVYAGKCKVQSARALARNAEAGEQVVAISRRELHVPVSAETAGIESGQTVALTASAHNPGLVGRAFRITDLGDEKSLGTARRFGIEEQ